MLFELSKEPADWGPVFSFTVAVDAVFRIMAVIVPTSPGCRTSCAPIPR